MKRFRVVVCSWNAGSRKRSIAASVQDRFGNPMTAQLSVAKATIASVAEATDTDADSQAAP